MKNSRASRSLCSLLAILLLLAVANVGVLLLPHRAAYFNVTGSNTYAVSETAARYVASIEQPVELLYRVDGGRLSADRDLVSYLEALASQSKLLTLTVEDLSEEDTAAENHSITVRAAGRSRTLRMSDLYFYYNSYFGLPLTVVEYSRVLAMLSQEVTGENYDAVMSAYGPSVTSSCFSGEANLIGAVRYVLAGDTPTVGIYSTVGYSFNAFFRQSLEQACYGVSELSTVSGFEGDLLILNLAADLPEAEAAALDAYLTGGGKVILSTNGVYKAPKLAAVTARYGLSAPEEENVIADLSSGTSASSTFYATAGNHPILDGFNGSYVAQTAHSINASITEGVTQTVLLRSPEASILSMKKDTAELPRGSFPLCVLAEANGSALLWLSMGIDSIANSYSSGANYALLASCAQWLTGHEEKALALSDRILPSTHADWKPAATVLWTVLTLVALPATLITVGCVRRYLRRKA